nr:aspartate aminotransferase, mitochondrial [Tanacetum cinerariifolium]
MVDETLKLAYGENFDLNKDKRIAAIQALSGTGACRIFDDFQMRFSPDSHINILRSIFQSQPRLSTLISAQVSTRNILCMIWLKLEDNIGAWKTTHFQNSEVFSLGHN